MREPERVRVLGVGVDLGGRLRHPAQFEQVEDPPVARLQQRLAVARRLGQCHHLGGDRQALVGVGGAPQHDAAAVEGGRQRPRVGILARLGHRVGAQGGGAAGIVVEQLDREARAQPHPQPASVARNEGQRLLEEVDHGRVGGGDRDPEPAVAERGLGEQPAVSRRPRELGGASKRVSRRGPVAGAVVCAAQPEEQLDALRSAGIG